MITQQPHVIARIAIVGGIVGGIDMLTRIVRVSSMKLALFWCIMVLSGFSSIAQAFRNLDFEMANVSQILYSDGFVTTVAFSNAFPYWQGTISGTTFGNQFSHPIDEAFLNSRYMDDVSMRILTTLLPSWPYEYGPHPVFGNYTAYVFGELAPVYWNAAEIRLAQTGLIPSYAKSIRFLTVGQSGLYPLTFSLNGNAVSYSLVDEGDNYRLWTADVSSLAGDTAEIAFAVSGTTYSIFDFGIDQISFSPVPAPEPTTTTLLAAFAGLVAIVRQRTCCKRPSHVTIFPK